MALTDLPDWLDERRQAPAVWFVKRLQANDTLATGSHQAGPYLPKQLLFAICPGLKDTGIKNPRFEFDIYIDSQSDYRQVRAIWYNNQLFGGTRDETRITGFGGGRSDLLDPESTGAVAVLAFNLSDASTPVCHAWVCRDETESDHVEAIVGRVDPGLPITWIADGTPDPGRFLLSSRRKTIAADGPGLFDNLDSAPEDAPTIEALVKRSALLQPLAAQPVDTRLLRRHELFIELFRQSEHDAYALRARSGFEDIASLLETAKLIRDGRRARGDDGLALQLRHLLAEEGLTEGVSFSFRPPVATNRIPDFVFPAAGAAGGQAAATILLVEPTIRDRWKAAIGAMGVPRLYMLTLQRGTSQAQYAEMAAAGITLVVPARLHDTYPAEIRGELVTLESFIADVRHLASPVLTATATESARRAGANPCLRH